MSTDTARRLLATLALVCTLFLSVDAGAQSPECRRLTSGETACPDARWRVLHAHSRAYELFCSRGEWTTISDAAPARIKALCDGAQDVHRIWVRSEKTREAQEVAASAQRKANTWRGRAEEVRHVADRYERQRDVARGRVRRWKFFAGISTGVATVSVGLILFDRAGWLDLTPAKLR